MAAVAILAVAAMVACTDERVRFGTEEYWQLPVELRDSPLREHLAQQGRRAARLHSACLRLGTVHGALAARQYRQWAEWTRLAERDPVLTEHVLTLWAKEYASARKQRRGAPRTVDDLAAWLTGRQNEITGSWAHPEAPLWLAIGETAEALRVLAKGGALDWLREPLVFLAIVHDPRAAAEVAATTYLGGSAGRLEAPVRNLAWLPLLQRMTRDAVTWDPSWIAEFRSWCTSHLLDTATGGYRCVDGLGMDITATYRLAAGWSGGEDLLTGLPSPQAMAVTIIGRADTLGEMLRSTTASLLVGSIADLDSLSRARACAVLQRWTDAAEEHLGESDASSVFRAFDLLARTGAWPGIAHEWLASTGCLVSARRTPSDAALLLRHPNPMPDLATLEAHVLAARLELLGST